MSNCQLKVEEYRVKNGGCMINNEERRVYDWEWRMEDVGLRVMNGGCKFKMEERRVGGEERYYKLKHERIQATFIQ